MSVGGASHQFALNDAKTWPTEEASGDGQRPYASNTARHRAFVELVMPREYLAHVNRAALDAEMTDLFGRDLADQPPIVMAQLKAMGRYDALDRLGSLQSISTLVASATHDRIALPAFGRQLAGAIPGARYVEIPDAGHAAPIQCAGEINRLLAEHLEGGPGQLCAARIVMFDRARPP